MKRVILVLLFVLLSSCDNAGPKGVIIPQGATVLILGDSLSYGTGAKAGEDYPSLLEKSTGWKIVNEGIPGDTSSQGLARLPNLLEEYKPQLLVIELGGNDLLDKMPVSELERNVKEIVLKAREQGVESVLVAIPSVSPLKAAVGSLSDHPIYKKISEETKTPLIAEVFSEVLSDRDLKSDQIHPNAIGYQQVAIKMNEAFHDLGYLK
ncbi:MAG: arylesterase [Methylophilus sp.]